MIENIKRLAVSALTLVTLGCQTSESIELTHKESQIFYEVFEIQRKELLPFIDNDILFTTSIKDADYENYWIWIGCYSNNNTRVFINELVINGNNSVKNVPINKTCSINELEERDSKIYNIYTGDIKVEINHEDLLQFVDENNKMTIKIIYTLNGEYKEMKFLINKRVITQPVFPT